MKKLALILSFIMCFSSTFFFAGCNTLTPKQNSNQNQEELDNSNLQIQTSVQTQTIGEKTWYFVYTASELNELCGFSVNIKLCNSIDLSSNNAWRWQNYNNSTFDGQGYTITFKPDVSLNKNYALFENTNASTIENLTIVANVEAYECSAALICYPKNTTIKNCTVMNSTITTLCTADSGYWVWAGGIVGKLNNSTIITNCMLVNSSVTLTNSSGDSDSYVFMCGGIAAECDSTSTITYCLVNNQNSNKISCMADEQSEPFVNGHNVYVGGVVGKLCNTLECCQNNSMVEGGNSQYTNKSNVGGIAGLAEKEVSNCCNLGDVTAYAKKTELSGQALFNAGILTPVTNNAGTLKETIQNYSNDKLSSYFGYYELEDEYNTNTINNIGYVVGGQDFDLEGISYSSYSKGLIYSIKLYETFDSSRINLYKYYKADSYAGGIVGYSELEANSVTNSYSTGNIAGGFEAVTMETGMYVWGMLTITATNTAVDGTGGQSEGISNKKRIKMHSSPIVGNERISNTSNNYYSGTIMTSLPVYGAEYVVYNNTSNVNAKELTSFQADTIRRYYFSKSADFYSRTNFKGTFELEAFNYCTHVKWYLKYDGYWINLRFENDSWVETEEKIAFRSHTGDVSLYKIANGLSQKGSKSSATLFTTSNKTSLNNITDSPWLTNNSINNGYPYLKDLFY